MCVCVCVSVPELDGQRLQGLIDGNKRWLEMRRKDASMYPSCEAEVSVEPLVQPRFRLIKISRREGGV